MARHCKLNRLLPSIVLLCGFFTIGLSSPTNPPDRDTIVIVVRHAEKAANSSDDAPLSDTGRARAQALAHAVDKAGVTAIFATQFQRTQQTVEPVAQALKIAVTKIDAARTDMLAGQVLDKHRGGVVLVAGHSNTIPDIIAALGGGKISPVGETQFDNLFVVSVPANGPARVLHLRYGTPD
jgi:broad specificity phosphatase PhoE